MKKVKQEIFLDGAFVAANKSLIKSLVPGSVKGIGVFETMRAYGGEIFLLREHINRLFSGTKALKIKVPYSKKRLNDILREALRMNNIKKGRIRLSVWRKNTKVHIAVVAETYKPHSLSKKRRGFSAVISNTFHKRMGKVSCIKSLDYSRFLKAYANAKSKGYDEAILLNKKGQIVEASRSNIFIVKNKTLITPKLASGCLNGITRKRILRIARDKGIKNRACDIDSKDLLNCDEAFLTNSLIEIMPITSIDSNKIKNGRAGSLTAMFLKSYKKL